MKLRSSYGDPPWLVTDLFGRVFAVAIIVSIIALVIAYWLTGPISTVDGIGTAICTVLAAYLVHLWIAPDRAA